MPQVTVSPICAPDSEELQNGRAWIPASPLEDSHAEGLTHPNLHLVCGKNNSIRVNY